MVTKSDIKNLQTTLLLRFDSIDKKLQEHSSAIESLKHNLGILQDTVVGINEYIEGELMITLNAIDQKVLVLDQKVSVLDQKALVLDQKVTRLEDKVRI